MSKNINFLDFNVEKIYFILARSTWRFELSTCNHSSYFIFTMLIRTSILDETSYEETEFLKRLFDMTAWQSPRQVIQLSCWKRRSDQSESPILYQIFVIRRFF